MGALLGTAKSTTQIEIWNSFEVPFTTTGGERFDLEYLAVKEEQYKQTFPLLEFLGWYCTSEEVQMALHEQVMERLDTSLFLRLLPSQMDAKDLPVTLYETTKNAVGGGAVLLPLPYRIETNEGERIAVHHVAHYSTAGEKEQNKLVTQLTVQINAIKMLETRIKFVVAYLKEVERGVLLPDQAILRSIASLKSRLPTLSGPDFDREFNKDTADVLLISYLTLLTKSAESLYALTEKRKMAASSARSRRTPFQ